MADYSDTAIRARVYQAQFQAYEADRAKILAEMAPVQNADATLRTLKANLSVLDEKIAELQALAEHDGVALKGN